MDFAKWEGLGNDYLILEENALPKPLAHRSIALLCDRHRGIGADGILLHCPPSGAVPEAAARMRIFNPDGSEPEMCGNGIREFARYLHLRGLVERDEFVVETLAGAIRPRLLGGDRVRVDMGRVSFTGPGVDTGRLGLAPGQEVVAAPYRFRLDSRGPASPPSSAAGPAPQPTSVDPPQEFTFVDVGNPHCVICVADAEAVPLEIWGPLIEHDPLFPARVNVEFVSLLPDGGVRMRVWERGVGVTQACGTGATAVGAAGVRLGLAQSPVRVELDGGELTIEVEEGGRIFMTGPATEVFTGTIAPDLERRLGW